MPPAASAAPVPSPASAPANTVAPAPAPQPGPAVTATAPQAAPAVPAPGAQTALAAAFGLDPVNAEFLAAMLAAPQAALYAMQAAAAAAAAMGVLPQAQVMAPPTAAACSSGSSAAVSESTATATSTAAGAPANSDGGAVAAAMAALPANASALRNVVVSPAVAAIVSDVVARMAAGAACDCSDALTRYFRSPETVRFLGVRTPDIRNFATDLFKCHPVLLATTSEVPGAGHLSVEDGFALVQLCAANAGHEVKLLGIEYWALVVQAWLKALKPKPSRTKKGSTAVVPPDPTTDASCVAMARRIVSLFMEGLLGDDCMLGCSWATVDCTCNRVISPIIEVFPDAILRNPDPWQRYSEVPRWNHWVRRACAVALVPLARHGKEHELSVTVVRCLIRDPEDLVQKGIGWLAKEASAADLGRIERLVRELHAEGVPLVRIFVRTAIEKFPAAKRQEIMQLTRLTKQVSAPGGTSGAAPGSIVQNAAETDEAQMSLGEGAAP